MVPLVVLVLYSFSTVLADPIWIWRPDSPALQNSGRFFKNMYAYVFLFILIPLLQLLN